MRRLVLLLVVAAVVTAMLALSAAPAFAFIDEFIPAGDCAASASGENAADNETAAEHLPRVPIQMPPAPDTCPAPK